MGYLRDPGEISPGDRLAIMYGPGEEVDIDFCCTDMEPLDRLRCKAILWVEVEKVVLISTKEEEE